MFLLLLSIIQRLEWIVYLQVFATEPRGKFIGPNSLSGAKLSTAMEN
jgi:hypothetical protein